MTKFVNTTATVITLINSLVQLMKLITVISFFSSLIAIVSIVETGWDIDLVGIAADIIDKYRSIREFIFKWIPYTFSPFWKDALIVYFLVGGIHMRMHHISNTFARALSRLFSAAGTDSDSVQTTALGTLIANSVTRNETKSAMFLKFLFWPLFIFVELLFFAIWNKDFFQEAKYEYIYKEIEDIGGGFAKIADTEDPQYKKVDRIMRYISLIGTVEFIAFLGAYAVLIFAFFYWNSLL